MSSHQPFPKKLEEELDAIKFYKANGVGSNPLKTIQSVMDDSVERAMYDEILGPLVNRNPKKPSVRMDSTHKIQSQSPVQSIDFTTSLVSRLKLVEAEAKESRRQLAQQISYNQKLEQEVIDLRCLVNTPDDLVEEVTDLKVHNRLLQHKIREMESFLSDYGLTWVGSGGENVSDGGDAAETAATSEEHSISFADFNRHIQELNSVVYAEPAQVITDGNSRKARLVQASELVENVKIVFYKNGLMIQRGPFRPCSSPTYASFVADVMDGYFPYEFKEPYPEGVTFDVKDRRDTTFTEGDQHSDQMSAAQFLSRLPKTVIRNGEVVSVRSDLAARLSGDEAATASRGFKISDESPAESKLPEKSSLADKSRAVVLSTPALGVSNAEAKGVGAAGDKVVQIQVRWVSHGLAQTLLAHMFDTDSVLDLRRQIAVHCNSSVMTPRGGSDEKGADCNRPPPLSRSSSAVSVSLSNIELRSAHPPRILADEMSLKEAGLVPNGTVHGRRI